MRIRQEESTTNELVTSPQLIADVEGLRAQFRQAQEALRQTQEKVEKIFASSLDGIAVIDLTGNITECNQETLKLCGFSSKEELIGKSAYTLVAKKDRQRVTEDFRKLLGRGGAKDTEYTLVAKEGREFEARVSASVVHNSLGEPVAVVSIVKDLTEQKWAKEELQRSLDKLQAFTRGIIQAMASIIEVRDPYTSGHQLRVTKLACAIAREMPLLSKERIDGIRAAGLVHDIGKMHVPAEILGKPGALTEAEFNIVRAHPKVGFDILRQIEFPWPVAQIVLQHHERMDGTGYPLGLSGDQILIEARILAVADVVEAMVSHRPYRPAKGIHSALSEILQNKGVFYDPKVVDACLRLFTEKGFRFGKGTETALEL